ncbi:MAG: hypothetical protein FJW85_09325, partial [Actinobacteria bacterium]|nr:hypothetical protein [Actinomycetota bacterium]
MPGCRGVLPPYRRPREADQMNAKRFLRGPLFWILLAVLLILVGSSLVSGIGGPERIDTSQAVADIQGDRVEKAVITDGDQVLELTLKDGTVVT